MYLLIILLIVSNLSAETEAITITKRAERLFSEKLYRDAIPFYSQLLDLSIEEKLRTQLKLRLATCYLEEGEAQTALTLLSPLTLQFCRDSSLYLMSLAYRQLKQSPSALSLLQRCLPDSQQAEQFVTLEKGYHFFQIGDFSSAQQMFEKIQWKENDFLFYPLAQLQLAKIYSVNDQFDLSLQALESLSQYLPHSHCLNLERIYLKGWVLLARNQYSQATLCFEELFPKISHLKGEGSIQILKALIISYLRQVLMIEFSLDQLEILLKKAEMALEQLLIDAPTETSYLLLTDFYLIKAKYLSDRVSYLQAQQLLNKQTLSQEAHRQMLLKFAEAAPSYQERNQLYEELSLHSEYPLEFYTKIWFLKGLNDLEEGLKCQKQQISKTPLPSFERASEAFTQTFELIKMIDFKQAALALKYQALSYVYQPEKTHQAWETITQLIDNPFFISTFDHPQEIYCFAAWIALHLPQYDILKNAKDLLEQTSTRSNLSDIWKERYLRLKGFLSLHLEEWQEADSFFARLIQEYPHSSLGEAWFWRAYCVEKQKNNSLKKQYLQQAYTQDPQSPYAPIAYFQFYSYRDYMHGPRKAIKHLQAMSLLFPLHPLLISAHYLIGLSHKKDFLSEEGQILKRKDWTAAIEAFQLAESTFDNLFKKNLIPLDHLSYFIHIRYRAQLERAQANLMIAQSSKGGKKQIYLEYAESVFKQIIDDFIQPNSLAVVNLVNSLSPYPKIWAEAEFKLAQIYKEKENWEGTEVVLNRSLERYQKSFITQDQGLMKVWYEKGKLAQNRLDHQKALECFLEAEKSTDKYLGLTPNEKLDLWIQQSLCHQELNELDLAMRLLSKVINDDVISPLRIKAMFLRAHIYELQGRPELAIKQLQAAARKGGDWAQQAQDKLEKIYGY